MRIGKELLKILPRARLEVFQECGHMLPEEKPEEGLQIVGRFMGEAGA